MDIFCLLSGRTSPISTSGITMTSWWQRWRLKSPASRLFTQPFIQTQIKENIKAPRHWPLCGEFSGTGEFPAQRASYAENVSIWWRHHGTTRYMCFVFFHSLSRSLVIWRQRSKRILVKLWNILHPSIHWCQIISHNLNTIGRYNDGYV